jgi:hypothetical protein
LSPLRLQPTQKCVSIDHRFASVMIFQIHEPKSTAFPTHYSSTLETMVKQHRLLLYMYYAAFTSVSWS